MAKKIEATTEQVVVEQKIEVPAHVVLAQETLLKHGGNKSKSIRELAAGGMSTGNIAKGLNIRYQFARNVLNQKLKKAE